MKAVKLHQPEFGLRLRELRTARRLSQRDLASGVVTASYISLVESGTRVPALDVLIHLANRLQVSLEELTGTPLSDHVEAAVEPHPAGPADVTAHTQALGLILTRNSVDAGDLVSARAELQRRYQALRGQPLGLAGFEIGFDLSDVLWALEEHTARHQLAAELAQAALGQAAPAIQVKALVDLAGAAREVGQLVKAQEAITQAAELLEESALVNTSEHARLLGVRLSLMAELGDSELGECVAQLLAVAEAVEIPAISGKAHWAIGTAYARLSRATEAVRHLLLAREYLISVNLPIRDWLRFCLASASVLVDLKAELDTATAYLDMAGLIVGFAQQHDTATLDSVRARCLLARGDAAAAEQLARDVLGREHSLTELDRVRLVATWGLALLELGRKDEAAEHLRSAAVLYEEAGYLRQAVQLWRTLDSLLTTGRDSSQLQHDYS